MFLVTQVRRSVTRTETPAVTHNVPPFLVNCKRSPTQLLGLSSLNPYAITLCNGRGFRPCNGSSHLGHEEHYFLKLLNI